MKHGSGVGNTEYKASALSKTYQNYYSASWKAVQVMSCSTPPKQAQSEKVRVVYCCSYNVRNITVAEHAERLYSL